MMYFRFPILLVLIFALIVGIFVLKSHLQVPFSEANGESRKNSNDVRVNKQMALDSIQPRDLQAHLEFLADDLLEGRDTGSRGARVAALYIASQFEKFGLQPVGDDSSYYQNVGLFEKKVLANSQFKVEVDNEMIPLEYKDDFLVVNSSTVSGVKFTGGMVFTGFGIQAPEYDYDDFKDLDVKGKITVYLSGEPKSEDESFFEGEKRTKYSRGGRKRKKAEEMGAKATIGIILPELFEHVSWGAIQNFYSKPDLSLLEDQEENPAKIPSLVLHPDAAKLIFAGTQADFEQIKKAAEKGRVQSFALGKNAEMKISFEEKNLNERNVVGFLKGSDPELNSELIVYTAHYDHIGIGTPVAGDSIYNGAADNASGVSGLLEVAEAFRMLSQPPQRSILFLAVTAEEKGLLGSEYYIEHPIFPLTKTVANFNFDMIGIGDTTGIVLYGAEHSTLGNIVEKAAQEVGLKVLPDDLPEERAFYRSDHYNFAKEGIPAIFPSFGVDRESFAEISKFYHKPSDEADRHFNYRYMKKHVQALFLSGFWVANAKETPKWRNGDEFEKTRKDGE